MLNFHDCLGFCALTQAEIDAIVEHEHIPEIAAAMMGNHLIQSADGSLKIKRIILDDIADAERRGRRQHAVQLRQVLTQFCAAHPDGVFPLPH